MSPPRNIVGPVVRQLREKAGLTQQELVAKLNLLGWDISRETLAKIESQIRCIADFELQHFADALGVSLERLFERPGRERGGRAR